MTATTSATDTYGPTEATSTRRGRSGLRIAVIGTRGVPAAFGGVEHHVEQLGERLVARGHHVTVFCRNNYVHDAPVRYKGMEVRLLPTINTKHMDAFAHSALSSAIALGGSYDIVHYHAVGPGAFAVIPRFLSGANVVLTVHGRDVKESKWGPGAKMLLATARWLSFRVPDAAITVSETLAAEYEQHRCPAIPIPNGVVPPNPRPPREIVERFGLEAGRYVLFVGRFVPEKAPDLLIEAFSQLPGDWKLVVAGGSNFTDDYERRLRDLAARDPRVVLPGYVYGSLLEELYTNAGAFVLPSRTEGMPLTVLEAASYATPIVVSDIAPHVEVLRGRGPGRRMFASGNRDELTAVLKWVLENPEAEREGARELRDRVLSEHSWDRVTDATEQVYLDLVAQSARRGQGASRPTSNRQLVRIGGGATTTMLDLTAEAPVAEHSRKDHLGTL